MLANDLLAQPNLNQPKLTQTNWDSNAMLRQAKQAIPSFTSHGQLKPSPTKLDGKQFNSILSDLKQVRQSNVSQANVYRCRNV